MLRLGLDDPHSHKALGSALATIHHIDRLVETIRAPRKGSLLHRLDRDLSSDMTVTLDFLLHSALLTARDCLTEVAGMFDRGSFRAGPAMVLMRAALLGAGRVVYGLGPQDPQERRRNCATLLRVESSACAMSITRLREELPDLEGIRPPEELVHRISAESQNLSTSAPKISDTAMLHTMADVIGDTMARATPNCSSKVVAQTCLWVWRTYSGVAHAHGWAYAGNVGELIPDLGTVTSVAHVAVDTYQKAAS